VPGGGDLADQVAVHGVVINNHQFHNGEIWFNRVEQSNMLGGGT
jgi:hypothetical protein